ncbi:phytanoyl-CoA dioxygenase family protein [Ramlibacter humi]|nr:phytanoyl-CoA dioxygenase family protein [Ramlibacter humi]
MGAMEQVAAAGLGDAALWRSLAPGLHLHDEEWLQRQRPLAIPSELIESLRGLLREEGYFQLPPQPWDLPIDAMAQLVRMLDERGIPLPFSFMYDEFWILYYRLHGMIQGLLGPGYLRLPDFWTWLVDPQRHESGWKPHRDKGWQSLREDRSPKSITIWLPLTRTTPLNGCMYLVPAHRDPTYGTPDDKDWRHEPADIRALPAEAGSVFCWTQALLHWGSRTSPRGEAPRISVAFEFQAGDVPPYNQPLTQPTEVPDLALRLKLVSQQILQYRHMYPLAPEVEALAKRLLG